MPSDLRELLDDAARKPQTPLDLTQIRRRARRSRMVEVTGAIIGMVGLMFGAVLAVSTFTGLELDVPVVDGRPDGVPTPGDGPETPTAADDGGAPTLTAADLGKDVLVAVDGDGGEPGHVLVHHPDRQATRLPIEAHNPSVLTIVPDDRGGFVWQPSAGSGGSPPVWHVDAEGGSSVVVPPTTSPDQTYTLVGGDSTEVLVAHRRGSTADDITVDLLGFDLDGSESRLVEEDVADWHGAVQSAASLEVSVYVLWDEGTSLVIASRPDADAATVFEGGQSTDELAVGVGMSGNGQGFALVEVGGLSGGAKLLVIDPFEATVVDTIEVPVGLGTDADAVAVRDISIEGTTVVVSRSAAQGWLRPLVYDTGDGTWSLLDVSGRALVAQPAPQGSEDPACSQDTERLNAPPTDGDTLDLYLMCLASGDFWNAVFRFDSEVPRTGDAADDGRAILERLFQGATAEQQDRGYTGLDRKVGTGTISIREVAFSNGSLTVDFDFPAGVGNYSTSAGSLVWHQLLAANLLQLDGVERIQFLADGDCESYSHAFESDGCHVETAADAPWNRESGSSR